MSRIRKHLTYANVISTLTLFLVLGGGTALAAYVVSSNSQIGPGTVSGHKPPSGKHANVIAGSINGKDVADRSGVDTCQTPLLAKFGPICAGSDGGSRSWSGAHDYCASFGLRLPSLGEAITLAEKYDVPGVSSGLFWTDNLYLAGSDLVASLVTEQGSVDQRVVGDNQSTVCVADPSA
jgi:hypothetical protein